MQQKRRTVWQRADAVNGLLECAGDVHVGDVLEADMAVADLNEAEVTTSGGAGLRQTTRRENASAQRPYDAGPGPGHALEEAAPVDAVSVVVFVENGAIA